MLLACAPAARRACCGGTTWPLAVVGIDGGAALIQAFPTSSGPGLHPRFGVLLPWLPISGRLDPALSQAAGHGSCSAPTVLHAHFEIVGSILGHMLAPALALALPVAAMLARVLRHRCRSVGQRLRDAGALEGASGLRVLLAEALPNALTPALSLSAVQFAFFARRHRADRAPVQLSRHRQPGDHCGAGARPAVDPGGGADLRAPVHRHQPGGRWARVLLNPRLRAGA